MRMIPAILLLGVLSCCTKGASDGTPGDGQAVIAFEASECSADGITIPYRYARINIVEGEPHAVVLVLHGGPLKGSDNLKQLDEAATGVLCEYLSDKGISAVLLAPHCPEKNARGRQMNWLQLTGVLHSLVTDHMQDGNGPAYIFGASIGGAGTWNMLSRYPGLFAGAMPCAANPEGCDAAAVAKTRIYTVMGTEDTWAPLGSMDLEGFLEDVGNAGGRYRLDICDGWDHETTCRNSFTPARLDWIFGEEE